ncbi:MAG TPA: CBS domain-containing protein [Candidatus Dormibacteraeota bacterium]
MKAFEIMTRPVITADPELPLKEAARLLDEHNISALPVIDAGGELVGIISEADLLELETRPDPRHQLIPLPPAPAPPRLVSDVMTRDVLTMPEDADVGHVAARMLDAHVKRIPIVRGRSLVGIVSRRDIVKIVARRDQEILAELEELIARQELMRPDGVTVDEGVVTIHCAADLGWRRMLEILVRTVPGVLEVQFLNEPAEVASR